MDVSTLVLSSYRHLIVGHAALSNIDNAVVVGVHNFVQQRWVTDMSVKEIENAITQLSPEELAELSAWLADYQAQVWDNQIERDLDAGRLDALLEEVDEEYEAGEAKPL